MNAELDVAPRTRYSGFALDPISHKSGSEAAALQSASRCGSMLFLFLLALTACASASPGDLPLVEVPSTGSGDSYAVLITGDGGWRHIDVEIAKRIAAAGTPVVGFSSPAYFR